MDQEETSSLNNKLLLNYIFILSIINIKFKSPFINIITIVFITHIISIIIIKLKEKYRKLII